MSMLRPDLAVIADHVAPGSRVLDIGCGDGALMAALRDAHGCDARGLEIDPGNVAAAVARGLEIEIALDEAAFEGIGCFPFAAVLNHFFAQYVSINAFTESVLRTTQRGEIMRWPMKLGRRRLA